MPQLPIVLLVTMVPPQTLVAIRTLLQLTTATSPATSFTLRIRSAS